MSELKHIRYTKTSDLEGSNAQHHKFTGNSAEVDAEWTQLKVTTPGVMTDLTQVRLAFKIGDDGSVLDSYGQPDTPGINGLWAYDPGHQSVNILRISGVGADGETFLVGEDTYELDTTPDAGLITDGNIRVDVSGGSTVRATGTLTFTGQPANNDTATLGSKTYTWKTTLTGAANEVKIGATLAESIENLNHAINGTGTAGTNYGTGTTANTAALASAYNGTTLTARAIAGGTAGNSIASTESGANTSWGAATLASGASPTQAEVTTAIAYAINNSTKTENVGAYTPASGTVVVYSTSPEPLALACSETMANGAWDNATMVGGAEQKIRRYANAYRDALAAEVTAGHMFFAFNFTVLSAIVQVKGKAWNGVVTIAGGIVKIDNSGTTDFAAGEQVNVIAIG